MGKIFIKTEFTLSKVKLREDAVVGPLKGGGVKPPQPLRSREGGVGNMTLLARPLKGKKHRIYFHIKNVKMLNLC